MKALKAQDGNDTAELSIRNVSGDKAEVVIRVNTVRGDVLVFEFDKGTLASYLSRN